MKKIYSIVLLLSFTLGFSQAVTPSSYYNGFDWSSTGISLKTALSTKIVDTHTKILNYSQAENALKIVDLDPSDATNTQVFLLYGFDNLNYCNYVSETNFGTSTNWNQHRRRHKEADVGTTGNQCAWNREHVYAQILGTPALGQIGAGADAHHLRTCDVDRNAERGSSKFGVGSGNSGYNSGFWYPGDEWKGDVARNMMYLYLRYPTQCKPTGVGSGATVSTDTDMIQLFLQWNAEDPVSEYEDRRNTYLGNAANTYGQGNRNPFIDNPFLATRIWGGVVAENRWPTVFLSNEIFDIFTSTNVYPNPSNDSKINIESNVSIDEIQLVTINGQLVQVIKKPVFVNNSYSIENLPKGFYFLKMNAENQFSTRKVIIN